MWLLAVLAIVFVGLIVLCAVFDNIEKEKFRQRSMQNLFENIKNNRKREMILDSKYGRCSRQLCQDVNKNYTVRIYEESQVIAINDVVYNFADIIGCQAATPLQQDAPNETITSTNNGNMALRAAIGGMAFGPVGALAGAVTAAKKKKSMTRRILIEFLVKQCLELVV